MYRIAVIGCGISGLAAACFLKQDGHKVELFERFDTPRPVGAGLLLQPTGLAVLASLGLDQEAIAMGARIHNLYGEDVNGSVIFDLSYKQLRPHLFGLGIHRAHLFSILHHKAEALHIPIQTGADIRDAEIESCRRYVVDKDGVRFGPFDLVIDASGMRSPLRQSHGQVRSNTPYTYGALWSVLEDPGQLFGKDYLQQRYDGARIMIGVLAVGKRPGDGAKSATFFWSLPVSTYETWRIHGLKDWKARVLSYWPEIQPLLDQIQSIDDLSFAHYSDTRMRKWNSDRLVFIGDAAHCTSPQLGQGANLGLIDALLLSQRLRENKDINAALADHTKARKAQISFYQSASRWLTPLFQSDSRAAGWVRNLAFEPMAKMPWIKTQMLFTLAGLKTGLLTHLNPGEWHPKYDIE